ncbi:MAG TPA: amidohydrolase family protein [candidate division Zixibacteria bacterium]|nr:amidohydrolase family protein [candidate division Zixibacteria bacterium]
MRYIDADGHVEESPSTFDDKYLDPAFRSRRPRVVSVNGLIYWAIEEQLFPRRVGRGCNNLGTPASYEGRPAAHSLGKPETVGCMELTDLEARLRIMDEEEITVQVLYPTLFLAYPLTEDTALASALCSSYNRWLSDRLAGQPRLKWAGVVNLDDAASAAREAREVKQLGGSALMVLGTAGERLLDDPALFPFYEAVCEEGLPLAVHVGWSCPSLNNLYGHIYLSGVVAFHFPVLMAFASLVGGGVLDRFPYLRVVFLEAGSMWIPYMIDRLNHRFENQGKKLPQFLPQTRPLQALPVLDYVKQGNLFFSAELEDTILPHVLELVGDTQVVMGTDMPHGDRERFAARALRARADLSGAVKEKILEHNPSRLYNLAG